MTTITRSVPALDQVGGLLDRGRAAMAFSAICLVVMAVFAGLALREVAGASAPPAPLVSAATGP
jgi:hypothetical protein